MKLCLLPVFAFSFILADNPSSKAISGELAKFQGSWKPVAIQYSDGRKAPADELRGIRLVVEGKRFTLTGKDYVINGVISIASTQHPKAIDVVVTSESGHETRILGIYEIEGERRRSCFVLSEQIRPKQFTFEKGFLCFEWTRN